VPFACVQVESAGAGTRQAAFFHSEHVAGRSCVALAAADLRARKTDSSENEIREGLSGNLCHCTGYMKVVEAARLAVSS
jgi:aerobic-type carbon monoxide dehydrogenase small subunit (CoxS/CutS family)